jgi:hypothetical protein
MFTSSRLCPIPRGSDLSPLLRSVTLAIVLAATGRVLAQDTSCTPVVPCVDSRGCPDLAIDGGLLWNGGDFVDGLGMSIQSKKFAQSDCAVQEGEVQAGTRKLLVFSTMTSNIGDGDVFLANYLQHPEWFDLGNCHGHPHLKDYADYRLWTETGYSMWTTLRAANPTACAQQILAAHPELLPHLVLGAKRGFCVIDIAEAGSLPNNSVPCPTPPSDPRKYNSCLYQGLSHCWADIYDAFTDGQWIDITNIPNGTYFLENETNAKHFITESNYNNNSAAVRIRIRGKSVSLVK